MMTRKEARGKIGSELGGGPRGEPIAATKKKIISSGCIRALKRSKREVAEEGSGYWGGKKLLK